MLSWEVRLNEDPVPWLRESDESLPAIRCYTLRDILDQEENDKKSTLLEAAIMAKRTGVRYVEV